ncbi:MAG: glycosyltransferase [Patescibacteria group bacterium]|jgi:glycosyltransferase involved in cell wall biosynthesis
MKILHVNKFFDLNGGAEVYMHELMRVQREAGHDVHVLSTRSPANLSSKDAPRFVARHEMGHSEGPTKDIIKAAAFFWNREAKRAMEEAIRDVKPDVIHLHNIYHHLSSSILSPIRKAGIPCVQTLHDLKLACPNYKMYTEGSPCERCKGGRYLEAVKHRCLSSGFLPNMLAAAEMGFTKVKQSYERTVHTFICPSDFMAEKMIEWGEPASKFTVVHSPVPSMDARAVRGGGYLLSVGRLSPEKGYEQLVHAARSAPDVTIKIAGTGPEEDRLRSYIDAHRMTNVELVGFKRGNDLVELYRNAEAYIACPIGYENLPLAVLDALGYGLPVLATRIGGLPEMVKDGESGFLVARGDTDAWHATLKRFSVLSSEEKTTMADASFAHGRDAFPDWSAHEAMIRGIYEGAVT